MTDITLDPERQKQAKRYARIERRLMLVDLVIGAVYTIAWLVLGWSRAVKGSLLDVTTNDWLLVAGFGAAFGIGIYLLGLPLSYYGSFVLPHRFGLSTKQFPVGLATRSSRYCWADCWVVSYWKLFMPSCGFRPICGGCGLRDSSCSSM